VQLAADDLLEQIQRDWPAEHEVSTLRLLARRLDEENQRLRAQVDRLSPPPESTTFSSTAVRPYITDPLSDPDATRHG
jgi:hypothetical protein